MATYGAQTVYVVVYNEYDSPVEPDSVWDCEECAKRRVDVLNKPVKLSWEVVPMAVQSQCSGEPVEAK